MRTDPQATGPRLAWVIPDGAPSHMQRLDPSDHDQLLVQGFTPYRMDWSMHSGLRDSTTVYIQAATPRYGHFAEALLGLFGGSGTFSAFDRDGTPVS